MIKLSYAYQNEISVEIVIPNDNATLDEVVSAMRQFLLGCGYSAKSLDDYIPEF